MTEEQKAAILAAMGDAWGRCEDLVAYADEIKLKAERIKAQIINIKKAAGLDTPSPKVQAAGQPERAGGSGIYLRSAPEGISPDSGVTWHKEE